jgi:catechol 2,3-dioxygenase-like lactoylglutathione lyase family enzyme
MQPRITVITLGVDDLDAAVPFYRDGLGFPTEGIVGQELEHGAVAFFDLQPGLRLRASVASAGLRNRRGHLPLELATGPAFSCGFDFAEGACGRVRDLEQDEVVGPAEGRGKRHGTSPH